MESESPIVGRLGKAECAALLVPATLAVCAIVSSMYVDSDAKLPWLKVTMTPTAIVEATNAMPATQ
jgi:hypothetical protein